MVVCDGEKKKKKKKGGEGKQKKKTNKQANKQKKGGDKNKKGEKCHVKALDLVTSARTNVVVIQLGGGSLGV